MNQFYFEMITELDQWFILERHIIISDDSIWTTKPYNNILQETNGHFMRRTPCGDNFYPFGEIICGG
jgi:hypothetical protein